MLETSGEKVWIEEDRCGCVWGVDLINKEKVNEGAVVVFLFAFVVFDILPLWIKSNIDMMKVRSCGDHDHGCTKIGVDNPGPIEEEQSKCDCVGWKVWRGKLELV